MTRLGHFALFSALAAAPLTPAAAQSLLWVRQTGTPANDFGYGVAVDGAGNAFITGTTDGSLGGPNAGWGDAFMAKYDASGTQLWVRQFGTSTDESGSGVAVDGAGNAYITGLTYGSLGGPNAGDYDVFLAKYDTSGTQLWVRQFGTSTNDQGWALAVDGAGNAYITGNTLGSLGGPIAGGYDVFLAKYDASGTQLWTRQFGTSTSDQGYGVAVDGAGNAFVTGWTAGSLGGPNAGGWDVFLAKYDTSGTQLWTRQIGTSTNESGYGVAVDGAGNAYIAGFTYGSLGGPIAGGSDVFLAKYDASGTQVWVRQFGTSAIDSGHGVAVDGAGNAYVTGETKGSIGGPYGGLEDAFLAKYDASGTQLWVRQLESRRDWGTGVAVDGAGNAYITGNTTGNFGGSSAGGFDVFLAKYGPPPCYPNCDGSTTAPFLNVADFICFLNKYAAANPYANCDNSTMPPILNVADFICFTNAYAAGCP